VGQPTGDVPIPERHLDFAYSSSQRRLQNVISTNGPFYSGRIGPIPCVEVWGVEVWVNSSGTARRLTISPHVCRALTSQHALARH
jgi:hypothetical protein